MAGEIAALLGGDGSPPKVSPRVTEFALKDEVVDWGTGGKLVDDKETTDSVSLLYALVSKVRVGGTPLVEEMILSVCVV